MIALACARRLFETDEPLCNAPFRPLRGIGLSDAAPYAKPLERLCDYTNTFFHREPFLDITAPGDAFGDLDFLIASDVFEHVPPPVERAFAGAFGLLEPGGKLILSVPVAPAGREIEHFPTAHDFEIVEACGEFRLINIRADGEREVFENLRFHGGPGTTLEFRIFSREQVIGHLESASFTDIEIFALKHPNIISILLVSVW